MRHFLLGTSRALRAIIRSPDEGHAMQPTLAESLSVRLENLERANACLYRQCARWRRGGMAMLAGAALLTIAGAAGRSWPTLDAREFVLRDQDGNARAALAIRPDGTP